MRVCMFVDKPLPIERPTGMGVAVYNMALALSRRTTEVELVCRGDTERSSTINQNLRVHTLAHYSRSNLLAGLEIVRKGRADIVHVHSSSAFPVVILARALGRKAVVHSHGMEPLRPDRLTVARGIGVNASHRVIAVSQNTRAALIRGFHLAPRKVEVAYNGVDVEIFRPSQDTTMVLSKYGLVSFDRIILSVGSLYQAKGQWLMIECLPEILKRWPSLAYVNVGSAYRQSYRESIMDRAKQLNVSSCIRMLDTMPAADLAGLMNAATVCVHPSAREGFGLAVAEEMACGKAVVASNVDSLPEIVDNESNGLLVRPNDTEELASSVMRVLDDGVLARRLGDSAVAKVREVFSWEKCAASLERAYAELVS